MIARPRRAAGHEDATVTTEDPKRGSPLRATLAATTSAGVVTYLADASFALSRGSTVDLVYFGFNALVTFAAVASAALLARVLRSGPLLALTLYAGLEGFAQGVGPSMLAGTALGLVALRRIGILSGKDGASSAIEYGATVGCTIAVTLILGPRLLVVQNHKLLAILLLPLLQLAGFGLYEIIRTRVPRLGGATPSARWAVGVTFACLFIALPLSFGEQRGSLPAELRGGTGVDKPHVLILVLDTVRADRMQIYGHFRDTTPRLARRIAAHPGAVVYPMAFAPSSWTAPSHASLFTGLYSFQHGIHRGGSGVYAYGSLPEGPTLAETAREAGYRTAALFANIMLFRIGDGGRGFDVHKHVTGTRSWLLIGERVRQRLSWDFLGRRLVSPRAVAVNEEVLRFFDDCGEGPCFVLANYMDAHTPRHPYAPHAGMYTGDTSDESIASIDRYDEVLRGLDQRIDELLVELDARGLLDHTWVFLTSDHGEAFGEHSVHGHGEDLYNEEVRIPLVVLPPEGAPPLPHPENPVTLIDVTTTAAAIASGRPLGVGRDLRNAGDVPTPVLSELYSSTEAQPARAVIQGSAKVLERHGSVRELYHLDVDPEERDDLAMRDAELAARLAELLPRDTEVRHAARDGQQPRAPTPEEEAALRALGYTE